MKFVIIDSIKILKSHVIPREAEQREQLVYFHSYFVINFVTLVHGMMLNPKSHGARSGLMKKAIISEIKVFGGTALAIVLLKRVSANRLTP